MVAIAGLKRKKKKFSHLLATFCHIQKTKALT
jgi:hypothetical protein